MSNSSRAWLLQVPDKDVYCKVVTPVAEALMDINYFDPFYLASSQFFESPVNTKTIKLERDFGWSNNIIKALDFVEEDVFFMGCEDHLLVDYNPELLDMAYWEVRKGTYGCVRLTTKKQIKLAKPRSVCVTRIDKSYKYYVSLQPTVWSKDYLKKIIRPNESSWQFEILASQRAKELDPPAGVTYKTAFNYKNLIEKGEMAKDPKTYTEIHGT